jgi:homocitrate synthase NifV
MNGTPTVTLKDVTLREGSQAAPVSFTVAEQRTICEALAELGIGVLQVGFAGRDDEHIRALHALSPSTMLDVLVPAWDTTATRALATAFEAGAGMCSVIMRSTDAALDALGYTKDEALELLQRVVGDARATGYSEVRVAVSYASEADPAFRDALYAAGIDAGATAIGYADTPGTATPASVREAVSQIRASFPGTAVHVHMHNDFGLAVANTMAAIEAGASWADVSVNGIGERAGNCPLEELAMALELLQGVDTGIDLSKLYTTSLLVARLSGQGIPRMKPIVGEDCFTNKLDMHVAAAMSGKGLFEPFDPGLIGRDRRIKLGYGSGPVAVRAVAARQSLDVSEEEVPEIVRAINAHALRTKREVDDDEFREIVESRLSG